MKTWPKAAPSCMLYIKCVRLHHTLTSSRLQHVTHGLFRRSDRSLIAIACDARREGEPLDAIENRTDLGHEREAVAPRGLSSRDESSHARGGRAETSSRGPSSSVAPG